MRYYYCPECDKAVLASKAMKKDQIVRKGRTAYCDGGLGSTDHELTKLMIVDGPPIHDTNLSKRFSSLSLLGSAFTAFIAWYLATLKHLPEPLGIAMMSAISFFVISVLINSAYFDKKNTEEEIRQKALARDEKEKIKKAYTLEWQDNLYGNGIPLFIVLGLLLFFFVILPFIVLQNRDFTHKETVVLTFFMIFGIGFFFTMIYIFLNSCWVSKLVPMSKKETKNLIEETLNKNDVDYEIKPQDYYQMKDHNFLKWEQTENIDKYVSDELDLEIITSKDYRGRYVSLKYNRIKNFLHTRTRGHDIIGSIKDTIDTFVEFY